MVTGNKFGITSLLTYAQPETFSDIITDDRVPASWMDALRNKGVHMDTDTSRGIFGMKTLILYGFRDCFCTSKMSIWPFCFMAYGFTSGSTCFSSRNRTPEWKTSFW